MRVAILAMACVFGAVAAQAQTIQITTVDCSRLVAHSPSADATYRPGVDAQGRAVAPADLNPTPPIKVPETIVFDVAADLRRFAIPPTSPLFEPNLPLGTISVERDGTARFNGQPLEAPEITALKELCRQRGAR